MIAFHVLEDVLNRLRHIATAVFVQIVTLIFAPIIPASVLGPFGGGAFANETQRTQVVNEVVLGENVCIRTAEQLQSDIVIRNRVTAEGRVPQCFHENARGVVDDEVLFGQQVATVLKKDAERTESAILNEGIAAKSDVIRVHDRRSSHVIGEQIVLKNIPV